MLARWLRGLFGPAARRPYRRQAPVKVKLEVQVLEARTTPAALVAAYAFNEGAGSTVADASGSGNGGTIGAATWTTAGKFGAGLTFNGTSALVTVTDSATLHPAT